MDIGENACEPTGEVWADFLKGSHSVHKTCGSLKYGKKKASKICGTFVDWFFVHNKILSNQQKNLPRDDDKKNNSSRGKSFEIITR